MDYGRIAIKLTTGFFGLWLITKLLGKKELSQLTPFDFVSSLMLSELVGNTIYDQGVRYLELLYSLGLWFALSMVLEKLTQFFPKLAAPLGGRPDIVICNGKIDPKVMRRNKLDMHQIGMLLRQQEAFSVRDVAYAIFETNGSLSVLKKPEAQDGPAGGESGEPDDLPCLLIDQGAVEDEELKRIGRDKAWLLAELNAQGVSRFKDVLYAEWSGERGLHIQRK